MTASFDRPSQEEKMEKSWDAQSKTAKKTSKDNAALCFKVPLEFRRWFKHQALLKDITMTELLVVAVESYLQPMLDD